MPLDRRFQAIDCLVDYWSNACGKMIPRIREEIVLLKMKLYHERVRVKARIYEGKAVIGGTIVGCIARLEAIRNTNPFAIVVEEASEVMEPLLFACLSTSTCKMEMIGDHLQLQPCVMDKFDFERINKINISLFERLIRAPPGHEIPSSVLSIQRRMRRNICDLTRYYYDDITDIQDHETCITRTIKAPSCGSGSRFSWSGHDKQHQLSFCEGHGREIPGVLPHVFFWTHEGREQRANVGLSKMNVQEAEMVCCLANYLVKCGVPHSSIAILTTYKGQLRLIQQNLRPRVGNRSAGIPPSPFYLSTVDRFQGDEADVVIVSLVIDGKSRTPFVRLVNRMIVLLSRARLGMYIVGNARYFEESNSAHWKRTLEILSEPSGSDNTPEFDEQCLPYSGSRVGRTLPICCPRHRSSSINATGAKDLRLSFCSVPCDHKLSCSHLCGLKCHWPDIDKHSTKCVVKVDSPCVKHPRQLKCCDVMSGIQRLGGGSSSLSSWIAFTGAFLTNRSNAPVGVKTIDEALKQYRCDVLVDLLLPCSHIQKVFCADEAAITAGYKPMPACVEEAIHPFVYPVCKHLKTCRCVEYHSYEANGAPPCEEVIEFVPGCGHSISVKCHVFLRYKSNPETFQCPQKVATNLPRCGHLTQVPCIVTKSFHEWQGEPCESVGVVTEGIEYGVKDYVCKKQVAFVRKCGHQQFMPCGTAFDIALTPPPCAELLESVNPECGHAVNIKCAKAQMLATASAGLSSSGENRRTTLSNTVAESELNGLPNLGLNIRCDHRIKLVRDCGHTQSLLCWESRWKRPPCTEMCEISSPVCGHRIKVPCEQVKVVHAWQPWSESVVDTSVFELLRDQGIVDEALPVPRLVPHSLKQWIQECRASLTFRRSKSCGHDFRLNCHKAFQFLEADQRKELPSCTISVTKQLSCGHSKTMKCFQKVETTKCDEIVQKPCWNFPKCGQRRPSKCFVSSTASSLVQCETKTKWTCSSGIHEFELSICRDGTPTQCPRCSLEQLDKEIERTQQQRSSNIPSSLPPGPLSDLDKPWIRKLCLLPDNIIEFLNRKLMLLNQYKIRWGGRGEEEWSIPLFVPQVIPVFAVLKDSLATKTSGTILQFTPREFVCAKPFNGMEVYELTHENLMQVRKEKKAKLSLLFGMGWSINVLCNPTNVPTGKKAHSQLITWIDKQFEVGNDAVLVSSRTSATKLAFWDPYVLYPTHFAEIEGPLDQSLLDICPKKTCIRQELVFVNCSKDWLQQSNDRSVLESPQMTAEETEKLHRVLSDQLGTQLLPVFPWSGSSLTVSTTLPAKQEQNLRTKLGFVRQLQNEEANQPAHQSVFAGMKMLQSLANKRPFAEADLLGSLEALVVNKKDVKDAEQRLASYVVACERIGVMNPLVLVALARVLERKKDHQKSVEILRIFADFYPGAVDKWLYSSELKQVSRDDAAIATPASSSGRNDSKEPTPSEQWEQLKQEKGCSSEAMDDLLKLTGLTKVKKSAVNLFKNALRLQRLSAAQRKKNAVSWNYCFTGNPGTGKTTVARLFAKILHDSSIRRKDSFVECTAQKLKDDGAQAFRDSVDKAMGGVVFIDEAYELDPMSDFKGKPIVSELLTFAENKRQDLSIILAGYQDDIYKKLYAYNDGLPSRFEEVVFEDFDVEDLKVIWEGIAQERELTCGERVSHIASRRLIKGAGHKGFGNARAVRQLLESAVKEAMSRDDDESMQLEIRIRDVIGERPTANAKIQRVLEELNERIGWRSIKQEVEKLIQLCETNYDRELQGIEALPMSLNRLFLGNPGTGKTTCAHIYGRILKHLKFLSNGEVVSKAASDFIGNHVGESQTKTNEILKQAKGKVLVIDEAYALDDNWYGKQVLDVLVEKVQGSPTDDIAVLLLGYENKMLEMLRTQNPGLQRRFSIQDAFKFEDYSEKELTDIWFAMCDKNNVECRLEVAEEVMKQLSLQKNLPNFGNAGEVDRLLRRAMANASQRCMESGSLVLAVEDVENDRIKVSRGEQDPFSLLDSLYRVDNIKKELVRLRNLFRVAQDEGSARPAVGHFVFRGSPGTGKTTVARVMAQILFKMELVATDQLVETSGLDLTGEYLGQTKKKVEDKLGSAKGGVLFIDEAYELGKGRYGEEAMTSLVAAMTNPEYAGMVIIIAGYPRDIDDMLNRNAGLKSRFTRFIDFMDWQSSDCVAFLTGQAQREQFSMEHQTVQKLGQVFDELRQLDGFGNGRDVIKLWDQILTCRAQRVVQQPEEERMVCVADVEGAAGTVLAGRRRPEGKQFCRSAHPVGDWPMQFDQGHQRQQASEQAQAQVEEMEEVEEEEEPEEDDQHTSGSRAPRDTGVSDQDWDELEREMDKYEAHLKDLELRRAFEEKRQEEQKRRAIQAKIRQLCPCPMGFEWHQVGGGWRCAGGGHFVTDQQLQQSFMK